MHSDLQSVIFVVQFYVSVWLEIDRNMIWQTLGQGEGWVISVFLVCLGAGGALTLEHICESMNVFFAT